MTYGPVPAPGGATFTASTPVLLGGEFGYPVRVVLDPVIVKIANEASQAYYWYWRENDAYLWGDWDKLATPLLSRQQFNQLSGFIATMGEIAFHYVNVDLGTPVALETYWLRDATYRFHVNDTSNNNTEPDLSADGQPLGPETYEPVEPTLLAALDELEIALGASTTGLRNYFISSVLAATGVDMTGVF